MFTKFLNHPEPRLIGAGGTVVNIVNTHIEFHYCPTKLIRFGLKPATVVYFINPSLKAGVIRPNLKPGGL